MGPARGFNASAVREIGAAIARLSDADLRARFDAPSMDALELYPSIWVREGEASLQWLLEVFAQLQRFLTRAVAHNSGILIWLN